MRSYPTGPVGRAAALAASLAVAVPLLAGGGAAVADERRPDRDFTIEDPRVTESSGLAASRLHPGVYWTHNDSDDGPYVFAVDSRTGKTVATVTMRGVGEPRDVEAVSIGPDGDIYVGDIGDNLDGTWDHVWIYRFPEPETLRDTTVTAVQYDVTYADGARDAEALMVHPKTGRVYIASKNQGGGGLYEGPERLEPDGPNVFRRVDEVPWVTDGAFSPDGTRLALRSYFSAREYVFEGGRLGTHRQIAAPFQRQAESVTYTADGTALMFGSEGERSGVVRVDVEAPKKPGGGSGGDGAHEGDGGDGGGKDGAEGGGAGLGAAVVLGAVALWFVLKRRRGQGG